MIRLASIVVSIILAGIAASASAQTWPERPIKLVVPLTPGGATDHVARVLAERMGRELGQQIYVDNRPGANGRIGTDVVAKAPPDGYTLLLGGIGPLTIHPHLIKLPYDPVKDFVPIRMLTINEMVIVVNPKVPAKTPAELIAWLKANSGKIQYGSSGIAGPPHLAAEMFRTRVGFDMIHAPYKGDSAAVADVVSGTLDLSVSAVSTVVALVQSGKLRAIAVTTPQRSKVLPDIPTLDEAGLTGFHADFWLGLFAPAHTPAAIIARLSEVSRIALDDPIVQEKLIAGGNNISNIAGPELAAFLAAETKKWGEVVHAGNIQMAD